MSKEPTRLTIRARERFLEVLRETCNVSAASRAAGVTRQAAYERRDADPAFAAAWADAVEQAADKLVAEAWRRGVYGVDKPIVHQGVITGTYKEYSDRMLEILLKGHRHMYREKVTQEHTGPGGGPVVIEAGERAARIAQLIATAAERRDADAG